MRFLLDDETLSGVHDVTTSLRPQRVVRPVDAADVSGVVQMMTYLCQVWGGHAHPIIPVTDLKVPEPYLGCLYGEQYDIVERRDRQASQLDLPARITQEPAADYPALIVAARERRELILPVEVTKLDPGDPWAAIYAATLGFLPLELDLGLQRMAGLREGFLIDDAVPVQYAHTAGSLEDLIERLGNTQVLRPRQLASVSLATGLAPDTTFLGTPPLLPSPGHQRRAAGPNIIVAVSEGSAADVALLWNFRGAHGDQRAMPIGLPVGQVTRQALAALQEPGIAAAFGLGGGACRLTSTSVPPGELAALAHGTPVVVVPYEELLTFGPAPGRPHSQVATFATGTARLEGLTESDRDALAVSRQMPFQPHLVLDVRVPDAPLPADLTMRGQVFGPAFQSGAGQVPVSQNSLASVQVQWPSPWTALAAVARTRGLRISPSVPGQAAATLIGALGSVDAIGWLAHRPLIDLLYRLAERSGMSWQKSQLAALRARLAKEGKSAEVLDEAEAALSAPEHVVTPAGEGRALGFEDFRKALSSDKAAARWVTWAERHHLLVRGVDIVCPYCRAPSWLPMASMPPPVGCPGCGRSLDAPYAPRQVPFAYRIGEPLRRVLETDSLGHVLALHWFTRLLRGQGLVGSHPGVDFNADEGKDQRRVGEADVLLLFADGRMVPVEVKRTAAGFDDRALELMDRLAATLEAPFDVMAVTKPARECPDLAASFRQPAGRPRLLISDDQILDRTPFWAVSSNPFAWAPHTEDDDRARDALVKSELEARDPDQHWDLVRDTLLGEP
ncbi:MAG TPA: hypothetical protein VGG75_30685 [Trebonia sp.]|jgi:hypothetical protein